MRKRLLIAAFILCSWPAWAATLFDQGNAKYKEGDFKGAVESYQKYIGTGRATAAAYFNLGNAALKAGEKGQALVYYEQARKAAPRDKDLLWNIRVLKGVLKDKIDDRTHFALAWAWRLLDKWTSNELALFFTAFLALFAVFQASGFFASGLKQRLRPLAALLWAGLFFSALLLAGKAWQTRDPLVVVLDKQVYAHYGPSQSETRAFLLHEGAQGRLLDESGDWILISLANGNSGWIRKDTSETV